jgi:hypothetical protein
MTVLTNSHQAFDVDEILRKYDLDWELKSAQVKYHFDGEDRFFRGKNVYFRSDNGNPIEVHGEKYGSVNNRATIEGVRDALGLFQGDAKINGGGTIDGGAGFYLRLKLPGTITLRNGRDILSPELFINAFHNGKANRFSLMMYRHLCENTSTFEMDKMVIRALNKMNFGGLNGSHKSRLIHKGDTTVKMEQIVEGMKNAIINAKAFAAVASKMVETKLTAEQAKQYFENVTITGGELKGEKPSTRVTNIRQNLGDLFTGGRGNFGVSLWDAYNAVTEYADHHRIDWKESGKDKVKNTLIVGGSGYNMKRDAMRVALETLEAV